VEAPGFSPVKRGASLLLGFSPSSFANFVAAGYAYEETAPATYPSWNRTWRLMPHTQE